MIEAFVHVCLFVGLACWFVAGWMMFLRRQ
jgi:hypothetical protein